MITDKEEHILNKLHVLSLLLNKMEKHAFVNRIMFKKFISSAKKIVVDLMVYIEPSGRIKEK